MFSSFMSAQERITVLTEHWPPFNYINDQGEIDGISTQIVRKTLSQAGIAFDLDLVSWKRAYKFTKENPNVLLYTIYKLENREDDFQWICPLVNTGGVSIYALASREDIKLASLEDAKQYSIGLLSTGWTREYFEHSGFEQGTNLDIGSDELVNIKKLFAGRIDLIVQEEDRIQHRMQQLGKNINDLSPVFSLRSRENRVGCMAMSLDTPKATVEKIQKALLSVVDQ